MIYDENTKSSIVKNLDANIIKLLKAKGFDTPRKAKSYLFPSLNNLHSPFDLKGMGQAVERILHAIAENQKIVVFGDYDCDGIGASAIMYLTLKHLGAVVEVFIPLRAEDGYGLSRSGVDKAIELHNPKLIITVDCGVSSATEVKYIKSLGIDVVVTDHHQAPKVLPECIIINPQLDENYPKLAGAGVAFKLCEGLAGLDYVMNFVDILAISTIADLVPLDSDNRIYARYGIEMLNDNPKQGIKELLRVSGFKSPKKVDSQCVAFRIAPRLNAAGRLSNAEKAFRLLVEEDEVKLKALAKELEQENKKRQELCQGVIEDCMKMLKSYDLSNKKIIILHKDDWEEGVIGIAASNLAQEFMRPVILLTNKVIFKGSCRSVPGVNIHQILTKFSDLLVKFGGHSMAAGLAVFDNNYQKFVDEISAYINENYPDELFFCKESSDLTIGLNEINTNFVNQLMLFEPYGVDNQKPKFKSQIGNLNFERMSFHEHVKCNYGDKVIIGFNMLDYLNILCSNQKKDIFYNVEMENYNGKTNICCMLREISTNSFLPNDNELFLVYTKKFIRQMPMLKEGQKHKAGNFFGNLKIAFTEKTFLKLKEENPNYKAAYGVLSSCNPANTIILSPFFESNAFCYYDIIEIYDNPPPSYVEFIKSSFKAEVRIYNNKARFNVATRITLENLRETFIALKSLNGKKIAVEKLYSELTNAGYSQKTDSFLIQCNIFYQLKLLSVDLESIIKLNNEKTQLTDSEIYMMVKDERTFTEN